MPHLRYTPPKPLGQEQIPQPQGNDVVIAPEIAQIQDVFQRWLVSQGKSDHTVAAYGSNVALWIDYLANTHGPLTLGKMTEASVGQIRSFLTYRMNRGIQKTSQAQWMASMKSFYQCLIHTGHATQCPVHMLQRPRLPRRLPRPMTVEDTSLFLQAPCAESSWVAWRNHAVFMVLYATGWRIQELLQLNRADWRPPFTHMAIVGKGKKPRITPILPAAQDALNYYLDRDPRTSVSGQSPLFIGEKGGRLCAGVVQKAMRQWRDAFGLPAHITPHSFRHSFATHLLDSGAHLRHVQELLGHVSVQSTQHYVHTTLTRLEALYKAAHPRAGSLLDAPEKPEKEGLQRGG